ncbi:hypothetical protein D3C76_1149670 [compost metagenome]
MVTRGADPQRAARTEVKEVGKLLVQFHAGGDSDYPTFVVIGVHAYFGDDVAALLAGRILVLDLDQRLLALVGVDLTNDDLSRARHLVHRQGGTQEVVGIGVVPVFQGAVAVGFP